MLEYGSNGLHTFEMGNYLLSLTYAENHLKLSEQLNDTSQKGLRIWCLVMTIANLEITGSLLITILKHFIIGIFFMSDAMKSRIIYIRFSALHSTYLKMNKPDSALFYANQRFQYPKAMSVHRNLLLQNAYQVIFI